MSLRLVLTNCRIGRCRKCLKRVYQCTCAYTTYMLARGSVSTGIEVFLPPISLCHRLYRVNVLSRPYRPFRALHHTPSSPSRVSIPNCESTHFSPFISTNVIINSLSFSLHSRRLCLELAFHRPQFRSCPVRINASSSLYRHIIYHQPPFRFDQFLSICTRSMFSCLAIRCSQSLFSCISIMSFTHHTYSYTYSHVA